MDLSASLHITQKGVDEVKHRVYKLSIKKRSVLFLLENPQTVEYVLRKTVFPQDEIVNEIHGLIQDGYVLAGGIFAAEPNANGPVSDVSLNLDEEIILSKARFLLIDFCVDGFGTQSQAFVDEIRASKSAYSLGLCLRSVYAKAEKQCPGRLPALVKLIKEINATA